MKDCVQKLNANKVDSIEITKVIICVTPQDCSFSVQSKGRPVKIFGSDRSGAGFLRTKEAIQGSTLFLLNQASQVQFENLRFQDPADFPVGGNTQIVIPYSAVIAIKDSQNIQISKSLFLNSWTMAVQVSGSEDIQILNSVISNSMIHGVWTDSAAGRVTKRMKIENNLFIDSVTNVLALSLIDSEVTKNAFFHNHRLYFYFDGNGRPFPGGQISVEPGTKNLTIESNIFRDGSNSHPGYLTSCIEFSDSNINEVRIVGNDFHHNTGAPVFQDVDAGGKVHEISKITIRRNRHYSNGYDKIFVAANLSVQTQGNYTIELNCAEAGCGAPLQFARVWPETILCVPGSGVTSSQCLTQLRWVTNDISEVRLQAGTSYNTVATGAADISVINWVSPAGADFFVYPGSTALDWTFVAQTPL